MVAATAAADIKLLSISKTLGLLGVAFIRSATKCDEITTSLLTDRLCRTRIAAAIVNNP